MRLLGAALNSFNRLVKTCQDYAGSFLGALLGDGLLSTFLWCALWIGGFWILSLVAHFSGASPSTTPFLVTMTVFIALIPKFAATLLNTCTDFKNISKNFQNRPKNISPYVRTVLAIVLIGCTFFVLIPRAGASMHSEFNPNNLVDLVESSWPHLEICGVLALIQLIFSFPDGWVPKNARYLNTGGGNTDPSTPLGSGSK